MVRMGYKDRSITPKPAFTTKRDTTNLLKETTSFLKGLNYTLDDIVYAGNSGGTLVISLDALSTTLDIDYDAGYGSVEIDETFIITLHDGTTLTRWSSDGTPTVYTSCQP